MSMIHRLVPALAAALTLVACTDARDEPGGQGNVRAIHAISDIGTLQFRIEAVSISSPDYLTATAFTPFDDLSYDFNFDYVSGLTQSEVRLGTIEQALEPDVDYTFVAAGTLADTRVYTVARPEFTADLGTDTFEIWFANLSASAGDIDIYLGEPDFDPAALAPLAAGVALDDFTEIDEILSERTQVVVTPAGDPSTILIRSEPTTILPNDRVLVALFDSALESTGDYVISLIGQSGTARLFDDAAPVSVQFSNASRDTGPVDVYIEPEQGPLTTPLFAGVGYGETTSLADVPVADDLSEVTITVTAAGNTGVELFTQDFTFTDGDFAWQILAGAQADDTVRLATLFDAWRPFADAAKVSFYNAIRSGGAVDVYLVASDETFDVESSPALLRNAGIGSSIAQFRAPPDAYQLYVVDDETDSIRLGPVEIALTGGDVVQLITTDTADADPNAADFLLVDLDAT